MTKPAFAMGTIALLLAGPAAADEATPVGRPFVMPGLGAKSSAGLEFQYATYDGGGVDVTVVTTDFVADVAVGDSIVLFGRLPIAFVDADSFFGSCCDTAIGNVTLGGRVRTKLGPDGKDAMIGAAEASVSLPTASDDFGVLNADNGGLGALAAGFVHVPHDGGRYLPNMTAIRGSGFVYRAAGKAFFEGELGLHLWIEEDDDNPMTDDTTQTNLKLGLAGGVFLNANVALLAELSNWANLSDLEDDGDGDESLWHAFDVGVRVHAKQGSFGARLYVPLDETFRDADMIGFGLDGRAEF